jgi:hypothetical protein
MIGEHAPWFNFLVRPPGNTSPLPALAAGWRDELPGPATGDEAAAFCLIQQPKWLGVTCAQTSSSAAFTQSGIGQSLHRRLTFAHNLFV